MSDSSSSGLGLKSATLKIGRFTASCVLVSNIIGGGIFTTTGLMARDLGDPMLILLLWFVGGLFAHSLIPRPSESLFGAVIVLE